MAVFVIVHGGFGGGWEWRSVAQVLQADGHEVTRPTLTGLGERSRNAAAAVNLETHIDDVVQHLEFDDLRDVALCGHSYGGTVVTGVADRVPERIARIVYIDAFVPRDGESLFDLAGPELAGLLRDSAVDGLVPPPGGMPSGYPAWYLERGRPHPLACFERPIRLEGRGDAIPRSYIKCLQSDVPLDLCVTRAREAGWAMAEIDTHHDAQIANPEGLARLLAARAGERRVSSPRPGRA
jgi:pimeloyl-ACP methyl ester carboxylesterase